MIPFGFTIKPFLQVNVPRVIVRIIEDPTPLAIAGEVHGARELRPWRSGEAELVSEGNGIEGPEVLLCAAVHLAELDEDVAPVDPLAAAGPLLCGFLRGGIVQEHDLDVVEPGDGFAELALLAQPVGIS